MALAATGVAGPPDWTALPADAWLNILRRVPGRGVVSCRCTCRRLEQLTRDEPLWQQQCHALAVQQLGSVVNGPNFSSTGARWPCTVAVAALGLSSFYSLYLVLWLWAKRLGGFPLGLWRSEEGPYGRLLQVGVGSGRVEAVMVEASSRWVVHPLDSERQCFAASRVPFFSMRFTEQYKSAGGGLSGGHVASVTGFLRFAEELVEHKLPLLAAPEDRSGEKQYTVDRSRGVTGAGQAQQLVRVRFGKPEEESENLDEELPMRVMDIYRPIARAHSSPKAEDSATDSSQSHGGALGPAAAAGAEQVSGIPQQQRGRLGSGIMSFVRSLGQPFRTEVVQHSRFRSLPMDLIKQPCFESTHTAVWPADPATLEKELRSLEGLWAATYSSHGPEILHLTVRRDSNPKLAGSGIAGLRLEAMKVTGDPNVPTGQLSWVVGLEEEYTYGEWRIADNDTEEQEYGPVLYLFFGHVRVVERMEHTSDVGSEPVLRRRCKGQINERPEHWDPKWTMSEIVIPRANSSKEAPRIHICFHNDDHGPRLRHLFVYAPLQLGGPSERTYWQTQPVPDVHTVEGDSKLTNDENMDGLMRANFP